MTSEQNKNNKILKINQIYQQFLNQLDILKQKQNIIIKKITQQKESAKIEQIKKTINKL